MARAVWNGAVIAESDATVEVEGNQYFPPDSVDRVVLRGSGTHTVCPWKGTASYFNVVVDGQITAGAVLFYPTPQDAATSTTGDVAFWRGVSVAVSADAGTATPAVRVGSGRRSLKVRVSRS
jgi:uncharacterized protein (DUF427 family)